MASAGNLEEIVVTLKNALEQGQQSILNVEKELAAFGKIKKSYQESMVYSKIIVALGSAGTIYSLSQIPSNFYQNKDMGVGLACGISVMGLGIGVMAWYAFNRMHQKWDTFLQQYQHNSQKIRELNQKLEEELRQYGVVKEVN